MSAAPKPIKSRGRRGETARAYSAAVVTAALEDVRLASSRFSVDPAFFSERKAGGKLDFRFGVDVSEPTMDEGRDLAVAVYAWRLEVWAGDRVVLSLYADFACTFANLKAIPVVAATQFIDEVGRIGTYPYFRAMASQLSWASGADLPILPIYTRHRHGQKTNPPKTD